MKKECSIHGLTEFSGLKRIRCKKCNVEAVTRRRKTLKINAVKYKGGCCQECGYNRCISTMEFHHRDPTKKDFSLSGKMQTTAWANVKAELDKCDLLCANCHRELHEIMRR